MGFLFGGKTQSAATPAVSSLQLQSSAYGAVISIVYGTTRIAPNLIDYTDFISIAQSSSAGSAGKGGVGGGGGGKGGGGAVNYIYQVAVALGLCEGPIQGVTNVYVNKNVVTPASLGLTTFLGSYSQAPWGYLISKNAAVTESHAIPGSAPYTVPVNTGFASDIEVVAASTTTYANVASAPAAQQYSIQHQTSGSALYTFNVANAGAHVSITYSDNAFGTTTTTTTTIPASAPYTVTISGQSSRGITDLGVVQVTLLTAVSSAPALNQYSVSAGVYTFNSGNAGATVKISYYTNTNTRALNYHGIAYEAASAYQLGNSAQLPNHNFEVQGVYSNSLSSLSILDADPSLVVTDFLTNTHYGVGFPSGRFGSFSTYQAYCIANGLWISPAYTSQTQASSILTDIAKFTNSAWVWSSGTLTLVPYGDQTITANGYTYTAPSAPIYDLTDDDFVQPSAGTDPVMLIRKRAADALNSVKFEYLDRSNAYNTAVIECKDQAAIDTFGLRQDSTQSAHLFADSNAAHSSAQLYLQRQAIKNTYNFSLDRRYILLDPMDIVTLTDANLGLNKQWVRITEITEQNDGTLAFVAEEYLAGSASAATYNFQSGSGYAANYNSSPGNANIPVIFEPPYALSNALQVWMAASGSSNWGGCDVYISTDGNSYKNAGRIVGPARQGLLTSSLPSVTAAATGPTIDTTDTLAIDLSESLGQLLSGTQADALNLSTLCYVDGEILSYQTATLTGSYSYALNWLVRGAYNTTIAAHPSGSQFARLDGGIFDYPYTPTLFGKTIYIKLLSFNIYGGGEQALSDVQPYAYTIRGTALTAALPNVTGFASAYIAGLTQLIWNGVTDFRSPIDYEIRLGSTWAGGQVIGRTPLLQAPILGDGTYWLAAHYKVPNGPDVYSATPASLVITGSQLTRNVIATYDEAATGWTGTFSNTAILANDLTLLGSGDILTATDITTLADVIYYGGVASSGTYTIPTGHRINIGRVAPCQVIFKLGLVLGYPSNAVDIISITDITTVTDILGIALGNRVSATPQLRLSQDGTTFGAWQNWIPGSYSAMLYDGRVLLQSSDPSITALLTDVTFSVDVPDLVQTGTNVAILAGGSPITFASPFNGGPGAASTPNIQITIINASAGDDVILTNQATTGFTVQIKNSGSGVARSVNYVAQGF